MNQGLYPEPLPLTPANDPVLSAIVWGAIILALLVMPFVGRLWGKFITSLSRHDDKLPAAERTLTDRLSQIAAMMVCALMWAILLYCVAFRIRGGNLALSPGAGVALTAAAALCAMIGQFLGYRVVGYTFSTQADTDSWIRSLALNYSVLAYWIAFPALGAMFFPALVFTMLWVAVGFLVMFRILLWIKTFRIFYDGPFSILYFFLYLCTLEIVPMVLPVGIALFIC